MSRLLLSLSLASWSKILIFCRSPNILLALNYNNYSNNNNNNNNDDEKNNNFEINNDDIYNNIYSKFNYNYYSYENNNYKSIDNFNQNDSGDITSYNNNIAIHNISNIHDYERQVLFDIYNTMNGEYWNWHDEYYYGKKWNFTYPYVNPCELNYRWQGIYCTLMNSSSLYYNIIKINLTNNNLTGSLPYSISNLTYLNEIIFDYNYITGIIPNTIENLKNLTSISFVSNHMEGTLPCFLFNDLSNLQMIAFRSNILTGSICEINQNIISNLRVIRLSFNLLTGSIPSSFYYLNNLMLFYMHDNLLSGRLPLFSFYNNIEVLSLYDNSLTGNIPYNYGNYEKLLYFYISDNYLTGTLPISFQKLSKLEIFIVNNNMLSGKLDYCFNSTNQLKLRTIDISHNQFSGFIPEELYKMKKLVTVAAVSNCFELSISTSICLSSSLESIIFDGLQTSSACRTYLFSQSSSLLSVNAYEISSPFKGQLPTCIFNMSTLILFHFSGNGLSGSIPNDIIIHPSMFDLSLSHNRLTGSIPNSIQSHDWLRLDLSKNYFNGKINDNFNSDFFNFTKYFMQRLMKSGYESGYESTFFDNIVQLYALSGNRLSGNIPKFFLHRDGVNILFGNSFSCLYDQNDLPRHDQNEYGYNCGSNTFNVIYFLWLSCAFLLVFIILILYYNYKYATETTNNKIYNTYCQYIKSKIQLLPSVQVKSYLSNKHLMLKLQNYTDYFQQYQEMNVYALHFLCFIIIIFLPLYLLLNIFYKTHEYKYAYVVSIMYLSGEVPAYLLLITFFIFQAFIRYCVINYITNNPYFNKKNDYNDINNDNNDVDNDGLTYNTDRNNINLNMNNNKDDRNSFQVNIRPSAITLYQLNKQVLSLKNIKNISFSRIILLYVCIFVINFVIVLGVNIAFVYVSLYQSYALTIIAQIFQAIFELIWDFCLPILIDFFCLKIWKISIYSKEYDLRDVWSKITLLLLFLILFNTIFIPCLVVAIVSPNCFYDLIISTPSVTSTFPFVDCIFFDIYGECQQLALHASSTSYDPPFNYSYQCSDDLISYYAPSQIYLCIILTFIYPFSIIMTIYVNKHYPENSLVVKLVRLYYPSPIYRTLYSDNDNINDQSSHEHHDLIYEANFEIIYFLQMIGALLTFGLVFPLIAITITSAIIILWLSSKYLCDRFLLNLIHINNIVKIESLNLECYGIINQIMIENSFRLISIFSSCFFSFFVYDILGDKNGYKNSYWIIIVTSLIPCYLYILELMYKYSYKYFIQYRNKIFIWRQQDTQEQQQQQQEQQQQRQSDVIEMTEIKSPLAIFEESI